MNLQQVHLKPDRNLLDPNFEGYKLSLEPNVAMYKSPIVGELNEVKLSEVQYSLQHVKCFSLHNHLYSDPWNPQTVYYVTHELVVYQVNAATLRKSDLEEARSVFRIPRDPKVSMKALDESAVSYYNVTMKFISKDFVLLANGIGTLFLLQTGDRELVSSWKELFSSDQFGTRRPFLLLDAVLTNKDSTCTLIDCLLLRIEDKVNVTEMMDELDDKFWLIVARWISGPRILPSYRSACMMIYSESIGWEKSRMSRLQGSGSIDYAAINVSDSSLWIASEKKFQFVYDSVQSIEPNNTAGPSKEDAVERKPIYAWNQSLEDVTVWFQLDEKMTKADVDVKMTSNQFCFKILNTTLLEGQLFAPIDIEGSTWIIGDGNKVEVCLAKLSQGLMWREMVKGDSSGEEIVDPELVKEIHERLAHLTSDKMNPDPKVQKLGDFNLQQLEECDDFPEHSFGLIRYDRNTLKPTHEISLSSHNWLFGSPRLLDEMPCLCVRYDVDGLLFIPSDKCTLDHVATFNAMGYVTASKQDKKFVSCSPDTSYAVLCDARKHVYIYFQPTQLESELRNRKTGKCVKSVAKQKVVTLDNNDVMGFHVSNKSIFILTKRNLIEVKVVEE